MVKQKDRKRTDFRVSTQFESSELEAFLKSVWGEDSPLAHVCKIYSGHGKKENTGLYAVIKHKDKIVGSAGMKFVNGNQLELGSLAITKKYRGLGLSEKLFIWRNTIGCKYVKLSSSVISYATLGSTVMNFIIPKMSSLTNSHVYPLNIAVGVIPISKDKALENINSKKMVVNKKGKLYTSTLAVISTKKMYFYEEIPGFDKYDFASILPAKCVKSNEIKLPESDNVALRIPGTRLVINFINSTDLSKLPELSEGYHQMLVPLAGSFARVHEIAREKHVITGFNVINGMLHIVYSNVGNKGFNDVVDYLKTLKDDSIYRFAKILYEMNQQ